MFWRLWAIASATLAIAMALFVGLILLQFQNIQQALLAERVAVLARNTAEPFKAATGIGMPLASVRNSGALLERARQTDDAIESILILGSDGRPINAVGTDGSELASLARPEDWAEGPVNLYDGGRFLSFNPIAGTPGDPSGAIVISLDASESINRTWAMGAELAAAALAFFGVGSLLISLALRRAFASEIAAFEEIERDVELFDRDTWRGVAEPDAGGALRRVLNEASESYRAAVLRVPASDGGT